MDALALSRFAADLDALAGADERLGLAVSGGPDSLALLILAAAARPGRVEAASVDHRLRAESAGEAAMVGALCAKLAVPHATLTVEWTEKPATAVQERARAQRYRLLGAWAAERGLPAVATGHHADDQAETLLMRLARGAGVRGLAGMRPRAPLPGRPQIALLRPLLGWRRPELEAVCAAAGVVPVVDPSNADPGYERVRVRRALAEADWLDAAALARSASNLAAADEALDWAAEEEWARAVEEGADGLRYRPAEAPGEIRRRIVARILVRLAGEGDPEQLGGAELDRLLEALQRGGTATLRGVRCSGGAEWRFAPAPPRAR